MKHHIENLRAKKVTKVNKSQKIRLYYGLFLTVLAVAVGVAFIVAVAEVYYGGLAQNPDYPFEIARIREHILVPFVLLLCFVAAVIGGIVISVIFPVTEKRATLKNNAKVLKTIKSRIPTDGNEQFSVAKRTLNNCEKARIYIWSAALAIFLAAGIAILVYSFNITHYHANALKSDILGFVKNVLIWTAIALVVGIAAVVTDEILLKRAITAAKNAIVTGDKNTLPPQREISKKAVLAATVTASIVAGVALLAYVLAPTIIQSAFTWKQSVIYVVTFIVAALLTAGFAVYNVYKNYVPQKTNKILLIVARCVVGVVAITFIFVGIFNGGANDVLVKAINICTECLGLG